MANVVSEAYLLGIKDERALMNETKARGELDLAMAKGMLATIEACLARGFAADMGDYMRGGRDFWRLQIKRISAANGGAVS